MVFDPKIHTHLHVDEPESYTPHHLIALHDVHLDQVMRLRHVAQQLALLARVEEETRTPLRTVGSVFRSIVEHVSTFLPWVDPTSAFRSVFEQNFYRLREDPHVYRFGKSTEPSHVLQLLPPAETQVEAEIEAQEDAAALWSTAADCWRSTSGELENLEGATSRLIEALEGKHQ